MSSFSWLLISDLHLKSTYTTWSQSVVLREMVRDIQAHKGDYAPIRFIIVSGDLAHGGKADEYKLVQAFLDDLIAMLALTRADVFMVPGNHDIDRDTCALAFHGSRSTFANPDEVEKYLSNKSERELLMSRLSAYYAFERQFCKDVDRRFTDDQLAFLCVRSIDSIPIAIVGLNSALTCGDDDDERNIVVGDRPIIDICEAILNADVRLVIGVLHHPPVWLRDFDKRTLEQRFLPRCDIVHRGHLHEQESTPLLTSPSTQCLLIAAGASYVWRRFENSYSVVSLDIAAAECTTTTCEYESTSGAFPVKTIATHPIRLRGSIPGSASDLHNAICTLGGDATEFAPYLGAILNNTANEVPVPMNGRVFIASAHLVDAAREPAYADSLRRFLNVRNSLIAFPTATPIAERVAACSQPIVEFSTRLAAFAANDSLFAADVRRRVEVAVDLLALNIRPPVNNFVAAIEQCALERDWDVLETICRRYLGNESLEVRQSATRHLALALANSDQPEKRAEGVQVAEGLVAQPHATAADFQLCFAINRDQNNFDRAETLVLEAIQRFGSISRDFTQSALTFSAEAGRTAVKERIIQSGATRHE